VVLVLFSWRMSLRTSWRMIIAEGGILPAHAAG
jgi:hypothetical protein